MLEETAQQVAKGPLNETFLTGNLALLPDGSKQLLLLESNAANATINTAIITSDTSRTQADYETPPPILCAAERQLRRRAHLAVPDVRVQDGVAVKNIHTGALLKKGKPKKHALVAYLNWENELMGDSAQHWTSNGTAEESDGRRRQASCVH